MTTLNLNGAWNMKTIAVSNPATIPATVPGSVYNDLLNNGLMGDRSLEITKKNL